MLRERSMIKAIRSPLALIPKKLTVEVPRPSPPGAGSAAESRAKTIFGEILAEALADVCLDRLGHRVHLDFRQRDAGDAVSGQARGDARPAAILLLLANLDLMLELSRLEFGHLCRRRRRLELRRRSFQDLEDDDTSKQRDDGRMDENADRKRAKKRLLALGDEVLRICGRFAHREASLFSSGRVMKVTDSIFAAAHSLSTSMIRWYFVFLAVRMVITVPDLASSEMAL